MTPLLIISFSVPVGELVPLPNPVHLFFYPRGYYYYFVVCFVLFCLLFLPFLLLLLLQRLFCFAFFCSFRSNIYIHT